MRGVIGLLIELEVAFARGGVFADGITQKHSGQAPEQQITNPDQVRTRREARRLLSSFLMMTEQSQFHLLLFFLLVKRQPTVTRWQTAGAKPICTFEKIQALIYFNVIENSISYMQLPVDFRLELLSLKCIIYFPNWNVVIFIYISYFKHS